MRDPTTHATLPPTHPGQVCCKLEIYIGLVRAILFFILHLFQQKGAFGQDHVKESVRPREMHRDQ